MYQKVPNCSGNSFVGAGDSYDESQSDYEEVLEFSSEGDVNDFSDFLWMENEEAFDDEVYQSLEEAELMNDCMEAMNELELLDGIKQVEQEQMIIETICNVAQNSSLNPLAKEFVPCSIVAVTSN
ncbi:CLUMA_CG016194, isoform A [Clunio marinus]|uniref:CLUMA_CG016194, isoform A n=1 Tax=Clunio marinus TaxID=568069 RepID=A0A1J1IS32_9DIPT|nr:CLUMA_CG016194, isoform A [Clunio marinus]